ncbi:MAG: hypothetical protein HYY78_12875 [Betaproteobacteria bacterium]|nr:hypothetical protein [Betaproteobacteria bacterium]
MKIWYQSLTGQAEGGSYLAVLEKTIGAVIDPGTTVHVRAITQSAGIGQHYRFLEYQDTREIIHNAIEAERGGYDAFLIGNISDAGLREVREMVNLPVLGMCETCLHLACLMGASFGLVAISERWFPKLTENVARYGLDRRLAGIEAMRTSPVDLKKGFVDSGHRQDLIAQFTNAARKLLARGAEVIIPAGGELVALLTQTGAHEIERAPILNGIVELTKMGEMAAKLKALTGRFTSKRLHYAPPSGDYLERVRSFYGPEIYPGAE